MSGGRISRTLDEEERLDRLRLIRTETIGPITFARLIARFGSARAALDALPRVAASAGRKGPLKPPPRAAMEEEIERGRRAGAELIAKGEPDYPALLAEIPDAPPLIYGRGAPALADRPCVAVIGARNASLAGKTMARQLAEGLGRAGIVVVSGLARGIDGAAHETALKTGTIAVIAGGIDDIYPPEHAALQERIASEGFLLTEQKPGWRPTARDFPRRNRLISGLSRGVVIVEAAAQSGTLVTARFALEQGREVFAVPGSPLDPRCQGANRLIRDGATLVETAQDILDGLAAQIRGAREPARDLFSWAEAGPIGEPDPEAVRALRAQVLEALSFTPTHRDALLRDIDAPAGLVVDALIDLVLAGEAEEHSGGRFSLRARE